MRQGAGYLAYGIPYHLKTERNTAAIIGATSRRYGGSQMNSVNNMGFQLSAPRNRDGGPAPMGMGGADGKGPPSGKTPHHEDVAPALPSASKWTPCPGRCGCSATFGPQASVYTTLKLPGDGRTVRFKTLGKQYTPEAIQRRILYPKALYRTGKESPANRGFLLLLGEKVFPQAHRPTGALLFLSIQDERTPKKTDTPATLCGRISAGWISGSSRRSSFSKMK